MLYIPVNNVSVMSGLFPGLNQFYAVRIERHNTVLLVRLEPTTPQSQVAHSTGEYQSTGLFKVIDRLMSKDIYNHSIFIRTHAMYFSL